MSHSLNNAKAQQFMSRVADYSTHGSRRGFVDVNLPIPADQCGSPEDMLRIIHKRKKELSLEISKNRRLLGVKPGKKLALLKHIAVRGEYMGSKDMSRLLLKTINMANEFQELESKYLKLKAEVKPKIAKRAGQDAFIDSARELLPDHLYRAIWDRAEELSSEKNSK